MDHGEVLYRFLLCRPRRPQGPLQLEVRLGILNCHSGEAPAQVVKPTPADSPPAGDRDSEALRLASSTPVRDVIMNFQMDVSKKDWHRRPTTRSRSSVKELHLLG